MLFNSHYFIFLFLPISFTIYWFINKYFFYKTSMVWLLICSVTFYGWWNINYITLLLLSIIVNYLFSELIIKLKIHNKINLINITFFLGISFNLLLLIYFKYINSLIDIVNLFNKSIIVQDEIILPLAISFFTIQQIVYLTDSYQGINIRNSLLSYSVYITFFPHLIAGPIVLYNELIPQFNNIKLKKFNNENAVKGVLIFSIGLIKKIFIADNLSNWVGISFDSNDPLTLISSWTSVIFFTFQIYFDFSGYSDMAIGIALLFNINLPTNFRSPYKAKNIITFWQFWHITLSRFISNYLYIPCFRLWKEPNFNKSMLTILFVMSIAGIWHGADLRFLVFGSMHGIAIIINHYFKLTKINIYPMLSWLITFIFINISFVIFRADNWEVIFKIYCAMFNYQNIGTVDLYAFLFLLLSIILIFFSKNTEYILNNFKLHKNIFKNVHVILIFTISLILLEFQNEKEFLYYKF